ncbi:MAG: GNAT family N-acetyltransferase [Firmicutes bacterium]|nr:GNAT family N-acetyltransferase [Bacillota bacterium]
MSDIRQFEKTIQLEISNLIDISTDLKNIELVKREKNEESKRVTIYQMKENSLIATAPSLYDAIKKFKDNHLSSKISIDELKNYIKLNNHKIRDKTIYMFLNPDDYKDILVKDGYKISKIDKGYKNEFNEFKKDCSKEDLEEGLVSVEDEVVYGCFYDDKLVGAASYWFWGEKLADIGVVIHPNHRKLGLGKALVTKLCDWGIKNGKINLYRHNERNKKSHKLALSLNFKQHIIVEDMVINY